MRRLAAVFVLAAAVLAPAIFAQAPQSTVPAVTSAGPACLPSTTLEELAKALDDAVSGPGNKDRACLRQLLLPDARLTPIRKLEDGSFAPRNLSVDDWINAVAKRGREPFYERQVKVQSERYGHFAHLWSTYEIRPTPSVQAIFDGARWRVLSILWEPDTTAGPVPEKYLP